MADCGRKRNASNKCYHARTDPVAARTDPVAPVALLRSNHEVRIQQFLPVFKTPVVYWVLKLARFFDDCVGVVIVDGFVVFGLDAVPSDVGVGVGA